MTHFPLPLAQLEFIPIAFLLFAFLFVLATFGFWIWMLVEAATKEPSTGNDKVVWILVIIFTHWIGALIYFLVRRPERIRTCGQ
ncbi:MAG TPA: PLD nuclease N-terminal domain-containing protein [Verrucomicrobiae bacterium]|nr:PLD nuclease N-terminal domain-containing protein [Verrucomicrobiae bacterium]